MARVFIALGGNQGDRSALLAAALDALSEHVGIETRSPIYETAAKYVTDQPDFLNMVIEGDTALTPEGLLDALKEIEGLLGRRADPRYGPRPIDLDILFYDAVRMDTPRLTIPHPRIAERRFVLQPLCDIAANLRHPVTGGTVAEMLAALPPETDVRPYSG